MPHWLRAYRAARNPIHALEPVIAPPAVASEFGSQLEWLNTQAPTNTTAVAALKMVLDNGESEAIALALELRCRAILDDRKAQMVAGKLGVPVTGTVGLLIKAKRMGFVPAIRPLLDSLDSHGFHIGLALREEALRLAGE